VRLDLFGFRPRVSRVRGKTGRPLPVTAGIMVSSLKLTARNIPHEGEDMRRVDITVASFEMIVKSTVTELHLKFKLGDVVFQHRR
jgi:hypothetical protein